MVNLELNCRRCGRAWVEEMPQNLNMFVASLKVICCPGCGATGKTKHASKPAVMMGQPKGAITP